ncbi:MAG: putative branched-chain amino acid transport system [Pseudonocardiales bacterium]|nr:putative branched-chain amino acid transport system [Pseudonocardiales bacterium]
MPVVHHSIWIKAAVVTVAATLSLSACSSSKSSSSSTSSASGTNADAALGPVKAATGTPLTLGYITDGKSQSIDFTSLQNTAQDAVKYVNERLGGVAGHPIKLKICETQQQPARATDCANQMIQADVPVVLNDVTGVGTYVVPPISKAGIPYISFSGATAEELTSKNAYSLTGSIAALLGGMAQYSKQQGFKKVAIVAFNIPTVLSAVNGLGKLAFSKAGVDLQVVPVAPGTADLSPQIQTAVSGKADAILTFADSTTCTASLKAARSLNYTGKLLINQECIATTSATSIPNGYTDVSTETTTKQKAGDKEYDLYSAVLNHYGSSTAKTDLAAGGSVLGYGVVLGFARAMAGLASGDVTSAAVVDTVTKAQNVALPVGGGVTFSCDGKALAILPGICSVGAQITSLNKDGTTDVYTTVDASGLFK